MYLRFDWSNNYGEFFRRELVKSLLTILKINISPAKLQTNKNAHAQTNLAAKSTLISPNGNPPLAPSDKFCGSIFLHFQSKHSLSTNRFRCEKN